MMHPEIAKSLMAQRHDELVRSAAGNPLGRSWRFPRWRISWSRMTLPPAEAPAALGSGQAAVPGKLGSSLVIIISAYR